jgi:hypothetical protein
LRRNLTIGVEPEGSEIFSQFGQRCLELFGNALPHQYASADATDEQGEASPVGTLDGAAFGLTGCILGPQNQAIKNAAHKTCLPAFRNIACEG